MSLTALVSSTLTFGVDFGEVGEQHTLERVIKTGLPGEGILS